MRIAHWILLIAAVMPYAVLVYAKASRDYDNAAPRAPGNYPHPRRKAAYAAHLNALEAFPLIAVAVLLASVRGADAGFVDGAALVWLAARLVYLWAYLMARAALRSAVWFVATFAALAIFLAALLH